jgi:hypothetical protein
VQALGGKTKKRTAVTTPALVVVLLLALAPPRALAAGDGAADGSAAVESNDAGTAASTAESATNESAAPVRITTSVDPAAVSIGTPFRYTMRIEADPGTQLVVPVLSDSVGVFSITDFGDVPHEAKKGAPTVVERWYTLVAYETGSTFIPAPVVFYRGADGKPVKVEGKKTLINLESVLGKPGAATDLRDIKGPVEVPRDYTVLWWIAGGIVLVIALAAALYWLLNRRRKQLAAPPRPAHEIALEALTRLRRAGLLEAGSHGEFYVRLSAIVRRYLEGRFALRAPEMTTEEFLQAAQRNRQLATTHRSALQSFLVEADLVKFARHVPTPADGERAYQAAREFVQSTAPATEEISRAAA